MSFEDEALLYLAVSVYIEVLRLEKFVTFQHHNFPGCCLAMLC